MHPATRPSRERDVAHLAPAGPARPDRRVDRGIDRRVDRDIDRCIDRRVDRCPR